VAQKLFDSPAMREAIRRVIRSRMALKGFEYRDLTQRLRALGVEQTESNLRSKVNNGSLGAQLFVYILLALDLKQLDLEPMVEILDDLRSADEAASEGD